MELSLKNNKEEIQRLIDVLHIPKMLDILEIIADDIDGAWYLERYCKETRKSLGTINRNLDFLKEIGITEDLRIPGVSGGFMRRVPRLVVKKIIINLT